MKRVASLYLPDWPIERLGRPSVSPRRLRPRLLPTSMPVSPTAAAREESGGMLGASRWRLAAGCALGEGRTRGADRRAQARASLSDPPDAGELR